MTKQVRLGIIGLGGMGSYHAKYTLEGQIPGLVLTAVADIAEARLDWARENLPPDIARFATGEALME
ncbi:MAG: gfo/Idh/MocA family oxidoreductase, partial [Ruminococcaceae bacterium]|nr:gfo/Idh/MocA family oxidoreductase [Oscillospiraceae bacterium]